MGFSGGLATIYDGAIVHPRKLQYAHIYFENFSKIIFHWNVVKWNV